MIDIQLLALKQNAIESKKLRMAANEATRKTPTSLIHTFFYCLCGLIK